MIKAVTLKIGLVLLAFLLISTSNIKAQDIHFSLYSMAPLSINPAHTGAFNGSFRIGGIYRDQYRTVTSQQFSTPMFYLDAPIALIGKKKRDWIGVGVMLFQDKAGLAQFQTGSLQASAALHHSFDETYKTVLSFGVQGGPVNRKIDLTSSALNFEEEVLTGGGFGDPFGQDRMGMDANLNYMDLAVGVMLRSELNSKTNLNAGLSLGHLLEPPSSFSKNEIYNLPMRIQAQAGIDRFITNKFSVSPSLYYTSMGPANQFQLQALGGYAFNENFLLNFGLGYRFADAGEILLGANINDIKVALSYDVTLSDLSSTKTGGAFELALGYIFKIVKEQEVKPVILCPHL